MFKISKDFTFSAGHRLAGLPDGHKCGRFHGHNYLVRVQLACPGLTAPGFVLDYGDLAPFGTWLDVSFDHRWLGSGTIAQAGGDGPLSQVTEPAVDFNPTAENLAAYLRAELPGQIPAMGAAAMTVSVGVCETPKTWAWATGKLGR